MALDPTTHPGKRAAGANSARAEHTSVPALAPVLPQVEKISPFDSVEPVAPSSEALQVFDQVQGPVPEAPTPEAPTVPRLTGAAEPPKLRPTLLERPERELPLTDTDVFNVPRFPRVHTDHGERIIAERYRILEELGEGGMARIFRVEHLALGKVFALKIIHESMSTDTMLRKAFIREARISSALDHPHIVQITDFGVDTEYGAFIVMEFLKGETLFKRIRREKRLSLPLALDIALHVAEALHYMHAQRIIHCDIKSENIFLSKPPPGQRRLPVVKLIDFGLSRAETWGVKLNENEVGGTPPYMPPEQINGQAPKPSMDIYAVGVLLYEMITGVPPFQGDAEAQLQAHLHDEPPPPSTRIDDSLDERVETLILRALRKDPAHRPRTMGQMVYELRTLMEMLGYRDGHTVRRGAADTSDSEATRNGLDAFLQSPCPQFRVDARGRIQVANPAFAQLVGRPLDVLPGSTLETTHLVRVYPDLRADLWDAATHRKPLQRVLTFRKNPAGTVSMLLWLVPESPEDDGPAPLTGIILPLSCPDAGVGCPNRKWPPKPLGDTLPDQP